MALTVSEMQDLIGAGWYKDTNGGDTLIFPVDVIDARVVWGNTQVLITPQGDAARGKRWVSRDKVVTGVSVSRKEEVFA